MPQPDVFGKSIYTFYIGQNDFTMMLQFCSVNNMTVLFDVVSRISTTIKEIYGFGGAYALGVQSCAVGLLPYAIGEIPTTKTQIDNRLR
ncbi:hypothetical protein ACS0TY_019658 [Phlomoides rotata]